MSVSTVKQIEELFGTLSLEEQLLLIERFIHRLRETAWVWENDLAAMAADPEIRRELYKIGEEFGPTEGDGLENH